MCDNHTEKGSLIANITSTADWPRYYVICSCVAFAVYVWQIMATCFGNCLVIIAYAKVKSLQTIYNKCLLSLAASDLMVAPAILLLEGVKHIWGNNEWARWMCLLGCWLLCASVLGSLWSVLLVSLNRFVRIKYPLHRMNYFTESRVTCGIKYPLHHMNYFTESRVTCAIVVMWVSIAVELTVVMMRYTVWHPGERCYPFAIMDSSAILYYAVPIMALPIIVITVLYIWIRLIVCKMECQSIGQIVPRHDNGWHKKRVNMLGLIIALLYVSYTLTVVLPYLWVLYFPCTNRWQEAAVKDISNVFAYLPSCLDPVIYHMGDKSIRSAINKILPKYR